MIVITMKRQQRSFQQFVNSSNNNLKFIRKRWFSFDAAIDDRNFMETLQYYGRKKQTPVSLTTLLETGSGGKLDNFQGTGSNGYNQASPSDRICIQIACFLHRELPVRLAHRAVELEDHPLFKSSPSIQNVSSWYKMSFAQLRSTPVPHDVEKEKMFSKVIESIYERHSSTLIIMAKGAHEIRAMLNKDINSFAESGDIQSRLDEFYMSRIGIRMVSVKYTLYVFLLTWLLTYKVTYYFHLLYSYDSFIID